jgi:hypothetical protein
MMHNSCSASPPGSCRALARAVFDLFCEKKTAREGPEGRSALGWLLAEPQPLDQALVSIEVAPAQVIEEATALTDELEQPPAGMMILDVSLEVLGKMTDPCTQQRDLYFRRTRIRRVQSVLTDDILGAPLRCFHSSSVFSS